MPDTRKILLLGCLLLGALPALAQDAAPAAPSKPAPLIGETEASRIYLEKARELANGQSDRELLVSVLARLLQMEARLTLAEKQFRNDQTSLREGVQGAFTSVGEEIGRINMDLRKLAAGRAPATPAPTDSSVK